MFGTQGVTSRAGARPCKLLIFNNLPLFHLCPVGARARIPARAHGIWNERLTFLLQRKPLHAHVVFWDGQRLLLARGDLHGEGDCAFRRAMHGATRANHTRVDDADDGGVGVIHSVNVSQNHRNARDFLENYFYFFTFLFLTFFYGYDSICTYS